MRLDGRVALGRHWCSPIPNPTGTACASVRFAQHFRIQDAVRPTF